MAPKKLAPYYCFYLEFRRQNPHFDEEEAKELVSKKWETMDAATREQYKQKAKMEDTSGKQKRFNCINKPIDQVLNAEQEAQQNLTRKKLGLSNYIAQLKLMNELVDNVWHMVHMNWFFKDTTQFYPAEIGYVSFSVKRGIVKTYHSMMYPSEKNGKFLKFPLGSQFSIKQHSTETHQIKCPVDPKIQNNVPDCLTILLKYLEQNETSKGKHFLFITDDQWEQGINHELEKLFDQNGFPFEMFDILPASELLFKIYNSKAESPWATKTIAEKAMASEEMAYYDVQSCEYHAEIEVYKHCSIAAAKLMAYNICSNCCHLFNIRPQKGRHLPGVDNTPEPVYDSYAIDEDEKNAPQASASSVCKYPEECSDDDDDGFTPVKSTSRRGRGGGVSRPVISSSNFDSLVNDMASIHVGRGSRGMPTGIAGLRGGRARGRGRSS